MKQTVFVNMASSIDGKIAPAQRGPVKLGSRRDAQKMDALRAQADAVMMGATTFRAHSRALTVSNTKLRRARLRAGKPLQPATVIISSRLDFSRGTLWERQHKIERVVACGSRAPRARRGQLERAGVKLIVGKGPRPTPREILRGLAKLGYRRILLEGGGEINGSFFRAGLVDRIYLTLCPLLIGGSDSPTIFEGQGFPGRKWPKWRLSRCDRRENEVFLEFSCR